MAKKKINPTTVNPEEIALLGIGYVTKKDEEKKIKSVITKLRKPLEEWMDAHEQTTDSGSKLCALPHAGTMVNLKRTLRTSKELVPEAEDILRAEGLEDCLETVTLVREDRIESMYNAGKITDEQLQKLYIPKENFAFSVTLTNEIPSL